MTYDVTNIAHTNTDIALSPKVIGNLGLTYQCLKNEKNDLSVTINGKYVGQQFLDNTSNSNTILPAYSTTDLHFNYSLGLFKNIDRDAMHRVSTISFSFSVLNLFNAKYVSNGYASRYTYAGSNPTINDPYVRSEGNGFINYAGFYPQAGRHFILSASVRF